MGYGSHDICSGQSRVPWDVFLRQEQDGRKSPVATCSQTKPGQPEKAHYSSPSLGPHLSPPAKLLIFYYRY